MEKEDNLLISSLAEYLTCIAEKRGTQFHSRTTNYKPIYRGQAKQSWCIEPAVYRCGRFEREGNYIRELERLQPEAFASMSRIEKLIKMQHYGLPTRLLDFTCNALVALYFACCSEQDADGVVYELHAFPLYHQDFVWVSIVMKYIFEFSRLPFAPASMIDELKREFSQYPPRGVESFYEEQSIRKILCSPLGLYPHFSNGRIKSQEGVFIIAGMEIREENRDGLLFVKQSYQNIAELWPASRSILIPAGQKQRLLRELEEIGFHKGRLFPELEAQAGYVTEYIDRLA
ncbi:MAG: FRG domain-containing protein [Bacillota bacterium]|nr:FRG domain-containing protein [Bacillota bacterium]